MTLPDGLFHADLHVHSKYSRATSRDLDLEHLAWWAARKGIAVVGTGDCVHPAWLAEIKAKLVPDGHGLFRLKPEIETEIWKTLPAICRRPVRFMLSTEISTIYKKGDRTRKVHHLIYVPDLASADRLAASLGRIGNIASDGRPILGLDSRDLLEVALQSGPGSYLVPAHIWTPWFAALGSQSGFDSIAECYGDLAPHIFAVETGLSSDPAMNWRVSFLDRYRLTSNSDAHSPGKLGREATRFSCAPDYFAIRRALETGEGYHGTVEFFPEEGKYHMDGHRNCGVRLDPKETIALGGLCPVCGGRVTVGVAHRVEMLADRSEAEATPPETAGEAASLVPLPEILSEIVGGGVATKAVAAAYDRATATLGPELSLLDEVPLEDVARANPLLGEAIARLRTGSVIRDAGYDGEYGVIRLFGDGELDGLTKGALLFDAPLRRRAKKTAAAVPGPQEGAESHPAPAPAAPSGRSGLLAALDEDQCRAAEAAGPLVVVAGPGSGKTRMLAHRIAHLVAERGVPATSCLAVTFTRRACEELRTRLAALLGRRAGTVAVHTFHSLGLAILRSHGAALGLGPQFRVADAAACAGLLAEEMGLKPGEAARLVKALSVARRTGEIGDARTAEALATLRRLGREHGFVDVDDLVALSAELLETDAACAAIWRQRFAHIAVDEFQDIDAGQYRLVRLIAPSGDGLCAIGDPDQAIYGFRGADAACFARFAEDYPAAGTVRLARNYRSSGTIVVASTQALGGGDAQAMRPPGEAVGLHVAEDERAEAAFVSETIEGLLGGHDMLAAHAGKPGRRKGGPSLGFADFAVLYRTDQQAAALREAFDKAGIPHAKSSPAPIAGHPAVRAVLAALEEVPAADLPAGIAAAVERVRGQSVSADDVTGATGHIDAAGLAEARAWLDHLAASDAVAGDAARFREQVALATEADFHDPRADRVSLLTMHAAKGLEFPVVFVVGLEAGLMPFSFDGGMPDPASAAEERRLLYVAMTRAKDRLYLSRASRRGGREPSASPFLAAIDPALLAPTAGTRRKPRARQFSLF
ncbi:TIGR00375 family protein [Pseudoxanthobacter soli DSM 19599]|uniref:TIGR00375 family protein n=1 Tax=Pseudoxanthobacter soli DSM 19599 TaxID=1123029 RepID=A0A1M7ZDA0_9HYPH|nr:UvrD-helicase domain-containing protein [Pseudoxanthobacter soli]SHO62860.1 TIGR00375 family protein [Pseudoxanthobacter soli DSM 19599]